MKTVELRQSSNINFQTKGHVSMGTNMYNCLTSQKFTARLRNSLAQSEILLDYFHAFFDDMREGVQVRCEYLFN